MNLLEAAKTGLRYKRPKWPYFYCPNKGGAFTACRDDILADDWEVEQGMGKYVTMSKLFHLISRNFDGKFDNSFDRLWSEL